MADVTLQWNSGPFQNRLQKYLKKVEGNMEQALVAVALDVLDEIKAGWPVDTGASHDSWIGPRKAGTLEYRLSNPFKYARVIEYGGYPHPREKTVQFGPATLPGKITINAGVYPRQRPAAPVRRALSKAYRQLGKQLQRRKGQG